MKFKSIIKLWYKDPEEEKHLAQERLRRQALTVVSPVEQSPRSPSVVDEFVPPKKSLTDKQWRRLSELGDALDQPHEPFAPLPPIETSSRSSQHARTPSALLNLLRQNASSITLNEVASETGPRTRARSASDLLHVTRLRSSASSSDGRRGRPYSMIEPWHAIAARHSRGSSLQKLSDFDKITPREVIVFGSSLAPAASDVVDSALQGDSTPSVPVIVQEDTPHSLPTLDPIDTLADDLSTQTAVRSRSRTRSIRMSINRRLSSISLFGHRKRSAEDRRAVSLLTERDSSPVSPKRPTSERAASVTDDVTVPIRTTKISLAKKIGKRLSSSHLSFARNSTPDADLAQLVPPPYATDMPAVPSVPAEFASDQETREITEQQEQRASPSGSPALSDTTTSMQVTEPAELDEDPSFYRDENDKRLSARRSLPLPGEDAPESPMDAQATVGSDPRPSAVDLGSLSTRPLSEIITKSNRRVSFIPPRPASVMADIIQEPLSIAPMIVDSDTNTMQPPRISIEPPSDAGHSAGEHDDVWGNSEALQSHERLSSFSD
ncbi:uncharacterized protein L969DRAFT_92126 [Mixia osmundae IAM 14324]|uniref:Uncharacterized protein n=1 Tax=Mixia osmundae (strain CBS 9802 / IAM 14324 / JCM 22182 / KY 12970) TaxID=764103 RepID=G7E7B9_MIXOS|nr:uncharacterized protein L969DRAFT_92126 [Mixia osmundae IAM 14324]KEI42697.1 hypothetical protein L969DRAFT_92126 [Mixia osmundae IAM 14324]GAA98729.1 hypothetical protein E5Q_05417 [Mixia osmundae IAM 14324]